MEERATAAGTVGPMESASSRLTEPYSQLLPLCIAVLVAALVVAWLLVRHARHDALPGSNGPVLVSAAELRRFAESKDQPVYWAGPLKGASYELTATPSGRTFVRYLPAGAAAGDRRAARVCVARGRHG